MKNLIIGLITLASIPAFATVPDLRVELSKIPSAKSRITCVTYENVDYGMSDAMVTIRLKKTGIEKNIPVKAVGKKQTSCVSFSEKELPDYFAGNIKADIHLVGSNVVFDSDNKIFAIDRYYPSFLEIQCKDKVFASNSSTLHKVAALSIASIVNEDTIDAVLDNGRIYKRAEIEQTNIQSFDGLKISDRVLVKGTSVIETISIITENGNYITEAKNVYHRSDLKKVICSNDVCF